MFDLEIWTDLHSPLSFPVDDHPVSDSQHLSNLRPGTQQDNIISAFELYTLSVTSKENGCCVSMVNCEQGEAVSHDVLPHFYCIK